MGHNITQCRSLYGSSPEHTQRCGIGINPVIPEGRTFIPPPTEQPTVHSQCSFLHLIPRQARLQHLSPPHRHSRRARGEGQIVSANPKYWLLLCADSRFCYSGRHLKHIHTCHRNITQPVDCPSPAQQGHPSPHSPLDAFCSFSVSDCQGENV